MTLLSQIAAAWRRRMESTPCTSEPGSDQSLHATPSEIPDLYESDRLRELRRFLSIQPPTFSNRTMPLSGQERSPVLLSFARHRRIPLSWHADASTVSPLFYLLLFLRDDCDRCRKDGFLAAHVVRATAAELYWTFDSDAFEQKLAEDAKAALPAAGAADERRVGGNGAAGSVARKHDIETAKPLPVPAEGQRPWLLKVHGRRYVIKTVAGRDDPDKAWEAIAAIEPLAWATAENAEKPTQVPWGFLEEVDLQPSLIVREFQRLDAERTLAKTLATTAAGLLKSLEPKADGTLPPEVAERVDETALSYRKLSAPIRDITEKLRTLKERAKRLGYYLPIDEDGDTAISFPVGESSWESRTLIAGRLYRQSRQSVTCTYSIDVVRYYGYPFWYPYWPYLFPIVEKHTKEVLRSYDHFEEIKHYREPWVDRKEALSNGGFTCLMTELTDQGYVCDNGVSLQEVMNRCRVDDGFREHLAVFLPVYQQSLTEGVEKVKYLIAVRPMPGYEPTSFPQVFCEEQLSYRADWRGYQLGELLQSVGLAPGEEREVTITRSESTKTERVESITTVLDVTRSQKDDLQTSLENRASKEQTSKNTSNWNVNASGSLFGFSAGGGGGGSNEQTSREFSEDIRKMATSATREMRANQRQEIKSSTSTTASREATEGAKSRFSNINQGSTLNLFFYQVNNVFRAGLFVDGLKFVYRSSTPLIWGTSAYDTQSFRLREFPNLLERIARDPALFVFAAAGDGGITKQFVSGPSAELLERVAQLSNDAFEQVKTSLLDQVVSTVAADYTNARENPELPELAEGGEGGAAQHAFVATGEALDFARALLTGAESLRARIAEASTALAPAATALSGVRGTLEKHLAVTERVRDEAQRLLGVVGGDSFADRSRNALRFFESLTRVNAPIEQHTLLTPSAATYVDAVVGALPATEPYSEQMRALELRLREARVETQQAVAEAVPSAARGIRELRLPVKEGDVLGISAR